MGVESRDDLIFRQQEGHAAMPTDKVSLLISLKHKPSKYLRGTAIGASGIGRHRARHYMPKTGQNCTVFFSLAHHSGAGALGLAPYLRAKTESGKMGARMWGEGVGVKLVGHK